MTIDAREFGRLVSNTPGLRINPVIYIQQTQIAFVKGILDRGLARHNAGAANAVEATVAALVFATPLMKAPGFAEEREWRLIFMPPQNGPVPLFGFHARRDFLAPYINLEHIWNVLRAQLTAIPELDATLGPAALRPAAHVPPLVPITKVMVRPSGHQWLNERAMEKLVKQSNRLNVVVQRSQIPYRSLA